MSRPLVFALPCALVWCALAAGGCPTVDVGDQPVPPPPCQPDRQLFESEIWPMALAPADTTKSCVAQAGCHSLDTGRSALRLIVSPVTPSDFSTNYDVVTRFLNCNTPDASSLLTKPGSGGDPHAGGDLWTSGSDPYDLVRTWIGTGQ